MALVPVKVMRDFWPNGPESRIRKGTVVEVDPSDTAVLKGIQSGAITLFEEPEDAPKPKKGRG